MVTTTHNCDVCHLQFPKSQRKEAEEHEVIPITEGNFSQVVLKCDEGCHYIFYGKKHPEEVNSSHERIYTEWLLCWAYEVRSQDDPKTKHKINMKDWGDYSISDLEGKIKGKRRLPLSPEELDGLKSFISKVPNHPDYLENLRTL